MKRIHKALGCVQILNHADVGLVSIDFARGGIHLFLFTSCFCSSSLVPVFVWTRVQSLEWVKSKLIHNTKPQLNETCCENLPVHDNVRVSGSVLRLVFCLLKDKRDPPCLQVVKCKWSQLWLSRTLTNECASVRSLIQCRRWLRLHPSTFWKWFIWQ